MDDYEWESYDPRLGLYNYDFINGKIKETDGLGEDAGKIYKDIRINSQYVIQLNAEHIKEYLVLKGIELPCDVRIGINDLDGTYSDLDTNSPIIVSCANYEQSQAEENF